ncbi:hypothetical protein [Leisingera daeponensis]|nr:hypothetical protein [Leisingera daeponensis]EDZ46451.1 hypothetical protein RBY4I_1665 [Rhodobacterales bacterium Y4I]
METRRIFLFIVLAGSTAIALVSQAWAADAGQAVAAAVQAAKSF